MGRTRLLLVRHAESLHAQQRTLAGPNGCRGLTDRGRQQARDLSRWLVATHGRPDGIDSSPVPRARETAETLADTLGLEVLEDPRLTEPDPGVADGLSVADYEARFGTFDPEAAPDRPLAPGGESWHRFLARVEDYVSEPRGEGYRWVVTHAGFMVWLVRGLLGATDTRLRLEIENCSVLEFEVDDGTWTLRSYTTPPASDIVLDTVDPTAHHFFAEPLTDEVRYVHGPDSERHPGVPRGTLIRWEWASSTIYPGTSRAVWTYVPAQHDAAEPASLMVFNDGWWYLDPDGEVRGAVVLDNLIHRGDLPPTIAVFVDPGTFPDAAGPKNRNVEYDAFDERYVEFLLTEVLPQVTSRFSISQDPERRGICGGSSGGNAAFTAAWFRPGCFGRAICFLSSFAQMPDGNPYPSLVPAVERKPLRVFLQAGHRDLGWNSPAMNWFAENLRTAAALAEGGYDVRLVLGEGGHSPNHGGVLLPDALRWAFRASS